MQELTKEQKEIYRQNSERRKARGLVDGFLKLKLEVSAIDGFSELWDSWVAVLGKEAATDNLIEAMLEQHERIRARLLYKKNAKVVWVKVSSPKLQEETELYVGEPEGS